MIKVHNITEIKETEWNDSQYKDVIDFVNGLHKYAPIKFICEWFAMKLQMKATFSFMQMYKMKPIFAIMQKYKWKTFLKPSWLH